MRRRLTAVLLGGLALTGMSTATAAAAGPPPMARHALVNPAPLLPSPESLITEGISIEGPLINNLGLPKLL
ncbi:hypothetical protein [Streptomyces sp. NRRL B-1347]|uniref:hypothetical protein n=1 Tax=Streptomyces sp. NRRL B-1347 TaxID=1476877 RepID=UPI0004CAC32F|nr:hypothetical protein [Streptomyces sp. NRRL B-1347]